MRLHYYLAKFADGRIAGISSVDDYSPEQVADILEQYDDGKKKLAKCIEPVTKKLFDSIEGKLTFIIQLRLTPHLIEVE